MTEDSDILSISVPATEKGKTEDGKTLYEEVELTKCLESLLGVEALEYGCPSCSKTVHALKWAFSSLPMMVRSIDIHGCNADKRNSQPSLIHS